MKFAANPPYTHGALSKYYKMPADCCYKLPINLEKPFGLDEAVLIEPLAVAVHSVRQVGVQPGDKVVVLGAGTIGLLCAAVAREYGASLITSVDISRKKLDFAESFVSDGRVRFTTVIPDSSILVEENAERLRATQQSSPLSEADVPGFDVAIEATGAEPCIQMAIHALRVGGSFVQTGLGNRNVKFPITVVSMNEITVKGCFRYGPGDYKMALELALMGKINLRSLITRVFPFEKVTDAWETTRRGEGIKTLIRGVDFVEDVELKT
jgi:D-xylulose reductase